MNVETELAYNRYRYYSPESGTYVSQDPIRLMGGHELYSYVWDTNSVTDPAGLSGIPSFDALKDMAQNSLDFSTSENGAVFWSSNNNGGSNMGNAQSWADLNGKTTLEQTAGGKYLVDLELFDHLPPKQAMEIWDIASEKFAHGASGDINVFSTGAQKLSKYGHIRTWWRIEKPILLNNSKVTSITVRKKNGVKAKTGHIKC